MNKCNEKSEKQQYCYTSALPLVAIGTRVRKLKIFEPIEKSVKIGQKTVKHRPIDKLMDAYIALLAGAQGMVEVNKRVRAERALQIAFGRTGCAEQSVVQGTLDASNSKNVEEMESAINKIIRLFSQGYRHDYQYEYQLIDIDMTGRPCGRKAALASKGYFAKQRNRRGRQEGYVLATWYEELVVARLYNGKTQLNAALKSLIEAAGRGVDVKLILPSYSDSGIVFHAGRSNYSALLKAGVKIYERHGALLHSKTALIDGVWSSVGSTNLDWPLRRESTTL